MVQTSRRTYRRARPARHAAPQRVTFRGLSVSGTVTSTVAITSLTDVIEALPDPDVNLLRSLVVSVKGQASIEPVTGAGALAGYHWGLIVMPESIDAADFDVAGAGAFGQPFWYRRSLIYHTQSHQLTASDQVDAFRTTMRTRGSRRITAYGQHLWLVQATSGVDAEVAWRFDVTIQLP